MPGDYRGVSHEVMSTILLAEKNLRMQSADETFNCNKNLRYEMCVLIKVVFTRVFRSQWTLLTPYVWPAYIRIIGN